MDVPTTTGTTYLWQFDAVKDGGPWNLTGGSATFYLQPPGTVAPKVFVGVPGNGIAQYTGQTTDLDRGGSWQRWWRLADVAGNVQMTPPVLFEVCQVPPAAPPG